MGPEWKGWSGVKGSPCAFQVGIEARRMLSQQVSKRSQCPKTRRILGWGVVA
jgi:hypothetical protein